MAIGGLDRPIPHQQLREDLGSAGILKLSDDGSISEEQLSSLPDLSKALMDAIMDAFEASPDDEFAGARPSEGSRRAARHSLGSCAVV